MTTVPAGYFAEGRLLVKYEAAWNAEDGVTIIRSVRAGVSGPAGDCVAATLEEAERALFAVGFLVSGEWSQPTYEGGSRWTVLTPFHS